MTRQPLSEEKLWDFMNEAWDRMSIEQRRFWDLVRVSPQKWKLSPWGDQGGGFWAVGLIGNTVLWYNDIEGGFNRSRYSAFGTIDEYWCNQDKLEWTVQFTLYQIRTGEPAAPGFGPSIPGEYK
ncbi:MAG: hypothetical protein AAGD11_17415 [Planctomycetota bacterium]